MFSAGPRSALWVSYSCVLPEIFPMQDKNVSELKVQNENYDSCNYVIK